MILALDSETHGLGFYDEAFLWSYAYRIGDQIESNVRERKHDNWVQELVNKADIIVMHNAKFDMRRLDMAGITYDPTKVRDTLILAHLLDENRENGLKPLARSVLGVDDDESKVMTSLKLKIRKKLELDTVADISYYLIWQHFPEEFERYARLDAEFTLQLYERFMPAVEANNLERIVTREHELLLELCDTEAQGMAILRDMARDYYKRYGGIVLQKQQEIAKLAGPEFNPESSHQLPRYLQEQGLDVPRTPKGNLSAPGAWLETQDHPMCQLVLDLRKAKKIRETYFKNILDESESDGLLHPVFKVNVRTGRMASGKESG